MVFKPPKDSMLNSLLDIILPDVCPFCEKAQQRGLLCAGCRALVETLRITGPLCTVCGTPFASKTAPGHACSQCVKHAMPFNEARSAFAYDSAVRDAIHSFKYGERLILAKPFGRMLSDGAASVSIRPDIIVPVPLHRKRLQMRGFNQSLLLARSVAGRLSIKLDYVSLRRVRATAPQIELKHDERQKNVAGAFEVCRPQTFKGKNVLLIDDVFTTGATVRECAKVLKKAGAAVCVLTLARAIQN